MSQVLPQELIRKKRDGIELNADDIREFVTGATDGRIADYQVAAMLMAIYWRGFTDAELAAWADAMLHSGDVLDLSSVQRPKVDKHSTGGVGDKISIPLAPAVAACGVAVPMISGRGLGHTGGTLDKLEAIPGFRVDLDAESFEKQVSEIGTCLIGQTQRIAPADKRFYSLRDVTGTVESIPLIASSIMSKKLAEGIDALVLDCKVGRGAFMKNMADAKQLASAIRAIGKSAGKSVTVLLTKMDAPIGSTIGNALEIRESIDVLSGEGSPDTRGLTIALGGEMLALAGDMDAEAGRERIARVLDSGAALDKFREVIAAQGEDPRVCDLPNKLLPRAAQNILLEAEQDGVVSEIHADDVGLAALVLGAGRRRAEDDIDPAVGIELCTTVGEHVTKGQPLARIHHNDKGVEDCQLRLRGAFSIREPGTAVSSSSSRVLEVIR